MEKVIFVLHLVADDVPSQSFVYFLSHVVAQCRVDFKSFALGI